MNHSNTMMNATQDAIEGSRADIAALDDYTVPGRTKSRHMDDRGQSGLSPFDYSFDDLLERDKENGTLKCWKFMLMFKNLCYFIFFVGGVVAAFLIPLDQIGVVKEVNSHISAEPLE